MHISKDRIGAIEPGNFADLFSVAEIRSDMIELEKVHCVMKDEHVVKNELGVHGEN